MSDEVGVPARPSVALRRLGAVLVVLGLVAIVWGVLHVANAAQGGRARRNFADRVGYNEAKEGLHRSFPGGVVRGLGGLALVLVGARLRKHGAATTTP